MPNLVYIDASKARSNFFNILMRVYAGEIFLVKKSGIPVAKISKPDISKKGNVLDFAGVLKELEEKKILNYIYKGRKDSKTSKRKLPTL